MPKMKSHRGLAKRVKITGSDEEAAPSSGEAGYGTRYRLQADQRDVSEVIISDIEYIGGIEHGKSKRWNSITQQKKTCPEAG